MLTPKWHVRLSWADTTASTFGRLWGRHTPALPSHVPLIPFLPASLRSSLGLPLARRKSLAGFIAASLTSGVVALGVWGWLAPIRGTAAVWAWNNTQFGGWLGLGLLSGVAAVIGGVTEALGM
jgi:diacylglycerol kinase (CTP)